MKNGDISSIKLIEFPIFQRFSWNISNFFENELENSSFRNWEKMQGFLGEKD